MSELQNVHDLQQIETHLQSEFFNAQKKKKLKLASSTHVFK